MESQQVVNEVELQPPQQQNLVVQAELVPFTAIVTSTHRDPVAEKLLELETAALALAEEILAIKVVDQESYALAGEKIKEAKSFLKGSDDFIEPIRLVTYGMYQKVLERKKGIQSPVSDNLPRLMRGILDFERKQEEIRQRRERELRQQQEREEQERKLAAATAAEAVGMDETSVQNILTAPSTMPAPVAAPTFQRVSGVTRREAWQAEVFDLHALVKAVAKDKKLLPLLEANMPALNAQARSLKTAMQIPGVKAVDKGSIAVRGQS